MPAGKGRAPDPGVQRRDPDAPDIGVGKNMYVLPQLQPGPGRTGAVPVVVAGGDEHRHAQFGKYLLQKPGRLRIGTVGVEQIPRQDQHVRLRLPDGGGDTLQHPPLLPPAQSGPLPAQGLKGGIQMQVRRVQYAYHSILSASTFTHRPVSVSISNTQHSIFPSPSPDR